MPHPHLEEFFRGYALAALWTSLDDDLRPLDKNYAMTDIDDVAVAVMRIDCNVFLVEAGGRIKDENLVREPDYSVWESAGHDFWLTRNRHGAGFWDGDWAKPIGQELTTIAHRFKEVDLYVGDDGKIHQE